MKRAIIVHRWEGSPDEGWIPWLKDELEADGFKVIVPVMPNPNAPEIEAWVSHLAREVGALDFNTFLIGHSIGCQAIMRFVERTPQDQTAGGAVFVAPWFTLMGLDNEEDKKIAEPWLTTHIDDIAVQERLPILSCIFSDDDYCVPPENKSMFEDRLQAYTIALHGKKHFTEEDGITELPEALDEIRQMSDPSLS